ncbi:MAG: hypothetical protein ABIZ49_10005 [Opitutaceae bacterium]
MNIEQQIRDKHRREDEARKREDEAKREEERRLLYFRDALSRAHCIARAMTVRELEIVMARLADRLNEENARTSNFTLRFKGMVLKAEFDLRGAGLSDVAQRERSTFENANTWEFKWSRESTEEYLSRTLFELNIAFPVDEAALSDWMHKSALAEIEGHFRIVYQKK